MTSWAAARIDDDARVASPDGQSLKVVIVINGLGTGGTQRSLAEMLPTYLDEGISPTVVCLSRKSEGVERKLHEEGFDLRFLDDGNMLSKVRSLRALLKRERPDLVHTSIFESDMAGRFAALGLGVPVLTSLVHTPYDPVRRQDPNVNSVRMEFVRLVDGWTGRRFVAHFHAVTHAVKEAAIRALKIPPESVTVIERGRDPERLGDPSLERRQAARSNLGIDPNAEVLLTLGRQEFQKGQKFLVQAVARLSSRPRLVLLVAGRRGHASNELDALTRELGVADRVRFLGHREDVPELLAAADLFAFPSLYEGIGGAVIEAMALALPIVASDLPTLREVVEAGGNALLVPPGSPDPLASAISQLLDDPDRRARFGLRSRELFDQRFAGDANALRMVNLYKRLARSV